MIGIFCFWYLEGYSKGNTTIEGISAFCPVTSSSAALNSRLNPSTGNFQIFGTSLSVLVHFCKQHLLVFDLYHGLGCTQEKIVNNLNHFMVNISGTIA